MAKRLTNARRAEHRYWAFAADPSRYQILDAIANLPIDWWPTDDKPVQPGHHAIIWQLSGRQRRRGIIALAEIAAGPELRSDAGNPYWLNTADAEKTCMRVGVHYIPLSESLWVGGPQHDLIDSLSVSRARGGTVFYITPDQWQAITSATGRSIESDVEEIRRRRDLGPTEREALVQARRGQGRFRQDLLQQWGGCAVVGCTAPSVLRASHIKPWKKSSDIERLNAANGLLLSANLDALFNDGLITFGDDGQMLISDHLSTENRSLLALQGNLRRVPTSQERAYLTFHRENVFLGMKSAESPTQRRQTKRR
jgi:HNH endonuclease/EVE domain